MRLTHTIAPFVILLSGTAIADESNGPQDWTGSLTSEVIQQRLNMMGYQNTKQIASRDDAIQFTVTREGRTWSVWISRRPLGPNNISSIDSSVMIEAQSKHPD